MNIVIGVFRLVRIAIYILLLFFGLIYLGLLYLWFRIIYSLKWWLALHRTKEFLRLNGIPYESVDEIARSITSPPPSLHRFIRIFGGVHRRG